MSVPTTLVLGNASAKSLITCESAGLQYKSDYVRTLPRFLRCELVLENANRQGWSRTCASSNVERILNIAISSVASTRLREPITDFYVFLYRGQEKLPIEDKS